MKRLQRISPHSGYTVVTTAPFAQRMYGDKRLRASRGRRQQSWVTNAMAHAHDQAGTFTGGMPTSEEDRARAVEDNIGPDETARALAIDNSSDPFGRDYPLSKQRRGVRRRCERWDPCNDRRNRKTAVSSGGFFHFSCNGDFRARKITPSRRPKWWAVQGSNL